MYRNIRSLSTFYPYLYQQLKIVHFLKAVSRAHTKAHIFWEVCIIAMKIGPFISFNKWRGELGNIGCVFIAGSLLHVFWSCEAILFKIVHFILIFFAASQGMKLWIKVQCIFHFAGCNSAALLHRSHGQCDFPWMQAVWHGNLPMFWVDIFVVYLLFVMHVSSSQCSMSSNLPRPSLLCCFLLLFTTILSIQLPLVLFTPPFHIFLPSCPLSCAFNNLSIIYKATLYMSLPNVCV